MPSAYDVSAVCKTEKANPYEAVTHLCVESYDGSVMQIPIEDAIEGIRCGRFEFFVCPQDGKKAKLRIARSPYNRFYLKAESDRHEPLALLKLPVLPH